MTKANAGTMSGAKMIVKALKDQGVEVVFGYPGGAVLPIYDELFLQNDIRHVLVRHEQGAIHMAEEGADFLEIYRFYREQGFSEQSSYTNGSRVFRGSTPDGLPFTKDLSYLKGFILIYNYIQLAVRKGKLEQIPLLFSGKTTLEDMRTLRQLVDEGLVVPPKYLPPQFRDLNALSAWMCFSNFLNHLSLERIEADIRAAVPRIHVTTHLEPKEDPVSLHDQVLDRGEP